MRALFIKHLPYIFLTSFFLCILTVVGWIHHYYLDGIDGWFWSLGSEENTKYASQYTDSGFRSIRKGFDKSKVIELIGLPLGKVWIYRDGGSVGFSEEGIVEHSRGIIYHVKIGMIEDDVAKIIGFPEEESWVYSMTPDSKSYRERVIVFKDDIVVEKIHKFYVD